MKPETLVTGLLLAAIFLCSPAQARDAEGFTSLFDGETLDGWEGDPSLWRVEDGAIVGQSTAEAPLKYNQFLTWKNGEIDDFELKLKYKIESGNSGIQIRSFPRGNPYQLGGYQADIDAEGNWVGTNYGEGFRGILAKRGQKATMNEEGKPEVTGSLGDPKELGSKVKKGEWNDYHIVARGHTITIRINGVTMSELTDHDTDTRRRVGCWAFNSTSASP